MKEKNRKQQTMKAFKVSAIRLNEWRNAGKEKFAYYDDAIDAMLLFIQKPAGRYVAFRVDDAVSLLYLSETKELIGVRFESFYKAFTRNLKLRERVWRLSDYDLFLEDTSDLVFTLYQDGNLVRIQGNLIEGYLYDNELPTISILFERIPVPA